MSEIAKLYYKDHDMRFDLERIIISLAESGFAPDYILGIARGGLVPAVYLSHRLDVPMLSVRISLRDHSHTDDLEVVANKLRKGKKILMIDDICDSGDTLRLIQDLLLDSVDVGEPTPAWAEQMFDYTPPAPSYAITHLKSAVLIQNLGQDIFTPDYIGRNINKAEEDRWVVFPWEEWKAA
jgi:hypoxanthine phosphoribosyltransferase